jgi:hypothetical protein
MIGKTKDRWLVLCEQAANEQDPRKMLELVTEINDLLAEKTKRLAQKAPPRDAEHSE